MLARDSPVKVDVISLQREIPAAPTTTAEIRARLMSCSAKPQPSDQGTARTKKIIKCDNALAAAVQCWTPRGPSREKPSGGGCARLHNLRRVAWGRGLRNATSATRWRGVGTGPARNWKIFERKLKSLSHGP